MAELYPAGVPTSVQTGSLSGGELGSSVNKLVVDIGKPMTRNKYTTSLFQKSFRIQMTKPQLDILFDWYQNTLNKVLSFNFPDPLTGVDREFNFLSPPSYVHIGVEQFLVTYNLRSSIGYSIPVYPVEDDIGALSSRAFYSFDLQSTMIAPLNKSAPEFNTERFSLN